VTLIERDEEGVVFSIEPEELEALRWALLAFPVDSDAEFEISRYSEGREIDEARELLLSAHEDWETSLELRIAEFVEDESRLEPMDGALRMALSFEEIEWALQALNAVRVGSWRRLGCPESLEDLDEAEEPNADHFMMEVCGMFQSCLLYALDPESLYDGFEDPDESDESDESDDG